MKKNEMTELKPCPFCGGKVELVGINVQRQKMMFVCGKCSAEVVLNDDVEWNTRHYPPEVEKSVERMKPKKPERRLDGWNCPICEMFQTHEWEVDQPPFCWNCGQALDWSDDEKESLCSGALGESL